MTRLPRSLATLTCATALGLLPAQLSALVSDEEETIDIVTGANRTIYEYRRNGILLIIKVVPKRGRPYYLMPPEGAPPFEGLEHEHRLYPRWVIVEW